MNVEDLERIKRLVASYPDAPVDLGSFHWVGVPRYWDYLRVPTTGPGTVLIHPMHEDRHAGVHFRVGWDERERVAALWVL